MIEEEQQYQPAPAGHNRTMQELAFDALDTALEPYVEQRERYLRNATNAVVKDRETAGAAIGVIRLGGEIWTKIERERLDLSNPYRDTADALGARAAEFWRPVQEAFDKLRRDIATFHNAERDRIAEQDAEQEAEVRRLREKAGLPVEHPAAAPAPRRKPKVEIRSDLGGKAVSVDHTDYKIVDFTKLPEWLLKSPKVHDAMLGVIRATHKASGLLPDGVETITSDQLKITR